MKKIFAFAIALVSMAVSMVSCVDSGIEDIERMAPLTPESDSEAVSTEFDGKLYFAVTDDQLNCLYNGYTVQIGDQTTTVNVENLPPTLAYPAAVSDAIKNCRSNVTVYVYTIPAGMKGDVVVTYNWVNKFENLPMTMDLFAGVGTNNHASIALVSGVHTCDLGSMLSRMNGSVALEATLR